MPQTRDLEYYPMALARGQRSKRALKQAVAEMYVQGVTTRNVSAATVTVGISIPTRFTVRCVVISC